MQNESQFKVSKFIKQFANKYNYVSDWMNEDVCKSTSFSLRLLHNAIHYCTLYNCCRVYLVNDLEQLGMKAISGRKRIKRT